MIRRPWGFTMKGAWLSGLLTALILGALLSAASADTEVIGEVWRGGFGEVNFVGANPRDGTCYVSTGSGIVHLTGDGRRLWTTERVAGGCISVNPTDGSLWVAAGDIVHVSEDGEELSRTSGFNSPSSVSVNSADGSCWVADTMHSQVVHLAPDGTELWRGGGPGWFNQPTSVSVNPTDGSCWVADKLHNQIVRLSHAGAELWRSPGYPTFDSPSSVAVNPSDGSCWVSDLGHGQVVRLGEDGTELVRVNGVNGELSVNPTDGSCWVVASTTVFHLGADGTVLWSDVKVAWSASISVDPADGTCWVADPYHVQVVHLTEDGTELLRWGFREPQAVSVNSADASCWVADAGDYQLIHLASDGRPLLRAEGLHTPWGVSVNPTDSSCWVTDIWSHEVVHLAEDGTELSRTGGFNTPESVSVNPTDGSCWVGDQFHGQVVHLAEDGTEVWRGGSFVNPKAVSVDQSDGSCWVADDETSEVVHLSSDGIELWRGGSFTNPMCLAVDPNDGSCWVANTYGGQVVHLAADGGELWRGSNFTRPWSVAVDPRDSSCWAVDLYGDITHVSPDGTELARAGGLYSPRSVSADAADGSVWVADLRNSQVVHVAPLGIPAADFDAAPVAGEPPLVVTFLDQSTGFPQSWLWEFGDGTTSRLQNPTHCYTAEGSYTVSLTVTNARDVDAETKHGFVLVTFSDLPLGHWAIGAVTACVQAGVVSGYSDGTYHPELPVTREQMAVYLARALVAPSGEAGLADYVPADPRNFPDVPDTGYGDDGTEPYWAYKHIEYCVENGVVEGYDDGAYHPDEEVARDQMAVYIARALVAPAGEDALAQYVPSDPRNFPDVANDSWSYRHIEYCVEHDVVSGYDDGCYHPEIVVTRDQMAVYVARAFGLMP